MKSSGGTTDAPKAGGTAKEHSPLLSEQEMLDAERKFLWSETVPPFQTGLALSGGGIRAATVALGVLQTLAERGLLQQFHYLSTVSGGGYIGSALSWFWSQKRVDEEKLLSPSPTAPPLRFGAAAADFPFQDPDEGKPRPVADPKDAKPRAAGLVADSADPKQRAVVNLEFLRNHGSYLTSGDGIGFAGLIVAVLRTILLSLIVWLPLLVAVFMFFEIVDYGFAKFLLTDDQLRSCLAGGSAQSMADVLQCRTFYRYLLIAAGFLSALFLMGVVIFSFLGRFQLDSSNASASSSHRALLTIGSFAALGAFAFAAYEIYGSYDSFQPLIFAEFAGFALAAFASLMLAFACWFGPDNAGYYLRRVFEKGSSHYLPITIALLFIGALPVIVASLKPDAPSIPILGALGPIGGVATLLSGVGTALYGYYLKAKSALPGIAGQIFATLGSVVFLSGVLLFSFVVARGIFLASQSDVGALPPQSVSQETSPTLKDMSAAAQRAARAFSAAADQAKAGKPDAVAPEKTDGPPVLTPEQRKLLISISLALFILAFLIGWFGSVNATGLHRFYRDRLMETFMPMATAVEKGTAQESDVADNLSVIDVLSKPEERGDRPYHLINAHAILVNDEADPKVALRGGDNFVISPVFVGSTSTGWMPTTEYVRHHGALTLASAMAVSGAAANANAGYIGTGLTRDRFVSTVMSFLNIRLGLWVGNPRAAAKRSIPGKRRISKKMATYFNPVLTCGILGYGHHRDARYLELSDGGHFENLGLYELVRRRLDLILVVDAEQDRAISLSALVSSANRIKEDFGVSIGFLDAKGPERLLGKATDRYPSGVTIAKSPFVVVAISYPELPGEAGRPPVSPGKQGVLIYIKSTMVTGLEFSTEGYRAANPDFPHQSTVDQFFDPDQFEAYRDLGKTSCASMIKELGLDGNLGNAAALLAQYGFPSSHMGAASRTELDHRPYSL